MIRKENSESIPIDLIIEILARLPTKSIARCHCVSKLWGSMLIGPYFTELFLTRSLARPPRILFAAKRVDGYWCFFTSPQPQNPYETSSPSSLTVAAGFKMKFPGDNTCIEFSGGLIYFRSQKPKDERIVICNPSTGQYTCSLPLPSLREGIKQRSFLGFDPINKHFKVLSIPILLNDEEDEPVQILTLGIGNDTWRKIHCPLKHFPKPSGEGISINGILYYFAEQNDNAWIIVCFDVWSEKFKYIHIDFLRHDTNGMRVINYKGKLGVVTQEFYTNADGRFVINLCMWVKEDVEKSEWSKYFSFPCPDEAIVDNLDFVGVTAAGEIVFSMNDASSKPFYVFFWSPERKTLKKVEIQGFGSDKYSKVKVFPDHVEDLTFITMKTTSITQPEQRVKQRHTRNII